MPDRTRSRENLVFPVTSWRVLAVIFLFALTPGVRADTVTLPEGLSVVTTQGYEMRIAMARQAAAAKGEDLTGARFKPQVNAYADQTWLKNQPEAVFGGGTSPLGNKDFLRYGVTVNQLVTDFGRTSSSVEAARAGARAQAAETTRTRNLAALDFVTSYITLLQAEKALTLTDLEVQRFDSHASDARALYEAGEVTLNDTLAAEVALADARLRRITVKDGRDLAASHINYLMLRPLESPTGVVDFSAVLHPVPDLADLTEGSVAERPELGIIEEQITSKEAQLSSAEADSYPTLFLSGGYSYEENSYRVHEDNWSATIGVNWELYNGGARTASRKQGTDELTELIARREQVRELINLEVRDSYRLLRGAIERTAVTRKAVVQAEESLRLQKSRYAEGEATATEVTDAVTSLAGAENNHWSAIYGRLKAEAQLLFAIGEDLAKVYAGSAQSSRSSINQTETGEVK